MESLSGVLTMALHNNLQQHPSITKDIGYLYNEILQNKPNLKLVYETKDDQEWWVGEKYNVWYGKFPIWVYNNINGEIIFEMTPYFPGRPTYPSRDQPSQEERANALWYEEWIKNYSSILIRTIPREIAKIWLDQANYILKTIENNIEKLIDEEKL